MVQLCESGAFPAVSVLQTDRESATFSKKFRELIFKKYAIAIQYLSKVKPEQLSTLPLPTTLYFYRVRKVFPPSERSDW